MSTIFPVAFAPQPIPAAMPVQASELSGLTAALSRDSAIAGAPALSASVNQLQSLAAAMPAPALPAPQLQPPASTDPLKQDYFSNGDDTTPAI
jgi:hypothetical protein